MLLSDLQSADPCASMSSSCACRRASANAGPFRSLEPLRSVAVGRPLLGGDPAIGDLSMGPLSNPPHTAGNDMVESCTTEKTGSEIICSILCPIRDVAVITCSCERAEKSFGSVLTCSSSEDAEAQSL